MSVPKGRTFRLNVSIGTLVMRKPRGRTCCVEKIDFEKEKVFIRDYGYRNIWVSFSTLKKKWARLDAMDIETETPIDYTALAKLFHDMNMEEIELFRRTYGCKEQIESLSGLAEHDALSNVDIQELASVSQEYLLLQAKLEIVRTVLSYQTEIFS